MLLCPVEASLLRFPLQDPVRLQRWLRNMGREDWTPSRHQYVCHQHFSPSCFRVRWGIRYLEGDAVPTLFQQSEKRKAADQSERKLKRLRETTAQTASGSGQTVSGSGQTSSGSGQTSSGSGQTSSGSGQTSSGSGQTVSGSGDGTSGSVGFLNTGHLYEVSVDQSQLGGGVDPSEVGEPDSCPETDLDSQGQVDGGETGGDVPFCQSGDLTGSVENLEVVVVSETQDELVKGLTATILNGGGSLVLDESGPSHSPEEVPQVHGGQEVIAYFETIPNVLPCETSARFCFSPDTVLSSALSSEPISSTLPIVSKHVPPAPLVLTLEDGGGATSEPEEPEQLEQLEEHRYHRDSLSKEQLEAIVAELQKKVKVLQQRHRRHLEKLVGLESTVSRLRQSNLLNEERLQLLERAFLQTTTAASDPPETVTIIYEDEAAYFYTPTDDEGTTLGQHVTVDM
ncbi:THAP domain-containing protein 5-like isoform X2 [Kryptolebias marmoratus]|uniref:THAP domain-containing protein 5-like isoform X2 n=1 Tax=Kryptolebias marmoratus TaxID=37003 RepID=UPI0018ACD268|nr:THAP domain-containing protein 5-like isoform X2 [Kryptolebias marmoratus]